MTTPAITKSSRVSKKAGLFTESVIREMTREALKHGAVNLAQGTIDVRTRIALPQTHSRRQRQARRHITVQRIMRTGLICNRIDLDSSAHDLGKNFSAVSYQTN